jgi:hypothetical protein
MIEHIAPQRHALGARLTGMGVLNHVLSDVVAQAVDLILVAMLEHTGKIRHTCFKAVEGIATMRFSSP